MAAFKKTVYFQIFINWYRKKKASKLDRCNVFSVKPSLRYLKEVLFRVLKDWCAFWGTKWKLIPDVAYLKTMVEAPFGVATVFWKLEKCQNIQLDLTMEMGCCIGTGEVWITRRILFRNLFLRKYKLWVSLFYNLQDYFFLQELNFS